MNIVDDWMIRSYKCSMRHRACVLHVFWGKSEGVAMSNNNTKGMAKIARLKCKPSEALKVQFGGM